MAQYKPSMFSDKNREVPNYTQIKSLTPHPATQIYAGKQTVVFIKTNDIDAKQNVLLYRALHELEEFHIPKPDDPDVKYRFVVMLYDETKPLSDTNCIPDSCIFYVMNRFVERITSTLPQKALIYTPKTVIELIRKGLYTDEDGRLNFLPRGFSKRLSSICMWESTITIAFAECQIKDYPSHEKEKLKNKIESLIHQCRYMCARVKEKWTKNVWTVAIVVSDRLNEHHEKFLAQASRLNKRVVTRKWVEDCFIKTISSEDKDLFFKSSSIIQDYLIQRHTVPAIKSPGDIARKGSIRSASPMCVQINNERSRQVREESRENLYEDLSNALTEKDYANGISTQMRLLPEPTVDIEQEPELPSQQLVWHLNPTVDNTPLYRRSTRPTEFMRPPERHV